MEENQNSQVALSAGVALSAVCERSRWCAVVRWRPVVVAWRESWSLSFFWVFMLLESERIWVCGSGKFSKWMCCCDLWRGKSIYRFGSLINKLIMIIQIIFVINPKQPNPCGIRSRNVNKKCPECDFASANQNPDLIRWMVKEIRIFEVSAQILDHWHM